MLYPFFDLEDDVVLSSLYWHQVVIAGCPTFVVDRMAQFYGVERAEVEGWIGGDGTTYPSSAVLYRMTSALNRMSAVYKTVKALSEWMVEAEPGFGVSRRELSITAVGAQYLMGLADEKIKERISQGAQVPAEEEDEITWSGGKAADVDAEGDEGDEGEDGGDEEEGEGEVDLRERRLDELVAGGLIGEAD